MHARMPVLLAFAAVLLGMAPSLGQTLAPIPETEFLAAARQTARYLDTVARRESVGTSWPISDRLAMPQTGIDAGAAGIGWFHLELFKATGDSDYLVRAEQAAAWVASRYRANSWNGPDWLAGAAGAGSFFLALHEQTRNDRYLNDARFAADWLLRTSISAPGGGRYWKHSPTFPKTYTGMYHGAAGIGLFLLEVYERTGDGKYLAMARDAARWMEGYAISLPSGGLGWKRLTTDVHGYHHYCGGSTGIMVFLRRMWNLTDDERYASLLRATADGLVSSARRVGDTASWTYSTDNRGTRPIIFCHGASSAAIELQNTYRDFGDPKYLLLARGAAAWTIAQGRTQEDGRTGWPHLEGRDQFETGGQTGAASVGLTMLRLHAQDPRDEYLENARAAARYLLAIADRPGEGQLRWVNYTNEERADWPKEFGHGWYTGASGVGMFLIELDAALRNRQFAPAIPR